MLVIDNLRDSFFQWDLDQRLIVLDESVKEVHFCNKIGENSLVVEVYEHNGYRVVDVPNILLQTAYPVRAFEHCGNCYTKKEYVFKVHPRSKPIDYVYTETEVKRWEDLEQRVIEGLAGVDEVIERAEDEIKKLQEVDLNNKADISYVDEKFANTISEDAVNTLIDERIVEPLNEVNAKIDTKAGQEDLNNLQKTIEDNVVKSLEELEEEVNKKATQDDLNQLQENIEQNVITSLNELGTEVNKKANAEDVETAINGINTTLETKASTEYVNQQLNAKVGADYVDTAIANAITSAINGEY